MKNDMTGGKVMTILLVEDNLQIIKLNREVLTMRGHRVLAAQTLWQGRELVKKSTPDLIVLDVMLPDGSGLDFCEELRGGSGVPILFLSAMKKDEEVMAGLKAGGDDYLPKPYKIEMLTSRVDALLRRAQRVPKTIKKGSLELKVLSGEVYIKNESLALSQKEFLLLCLFMQNENIYLSPEYLYEQVWGQKMLANDTSVKNALYRLRKKLEESGYTLTTERGKGYCFERG